MSVPDQHAPASSRWLLPTSPLVCDIADTPLIGMRLGLYAPVKDVLLVGAEAASGGHAPHGLADFGLKATAGIISGGLAAGLTSPTELVKTRLQAKASQSKSTWGIMRQVVRESGVAGLWRGAVPSMVSAC